VVEFKETHLGPLKNPLSSRSTSTSTIKAEAPAEPIDEKASVASSNDIGTRLIGEMECELTESSGFGSPGLPSSGADETRYLNRHAA
jgi:hypothetical protein